MKRVAYLILHAFAALGEAYYLTRLTPYVDDDTAVRAAFDEIVRCEWGADAVPAARTRRPARVPSLVPWYRIQLWQRG
jgi:hypothetical protein